ncbi:flagellar hook-length control protein FliK [Sulfitobacter sp. S0837]|uniref:flagellar hook-length control protein FliK n=1 Tax=Sulfitobacter maritimus TaxID=2741719 RepID=UPI001583B3D9|nr:flagellar hook-length control protein FliK [Sulfitobacter maritimus]NUH64943.1 flagellar hook-length control protein FliK [Sulfitobacter maritimus]
MPKGLTPQAEAVADAQAETDAPPTPETAEDLMALLDDTIAGLHEGSAPVTPKSALASFAKALGEGPVETVGDLSAVAQLADPEVEAAVQDKINGALRVVSGAGQLSVASAGVPMVGRNMTTAAAQPSDASTAPTPGAQIVIAAGLSATKSAVPQGLQTGAGSAVTPASGGGGGASVSLRHDGAASSTVEADAILNSAAPRSAVSEQFAEAVKVLQTAVPGNGADAVLREATTASQSGPAGEPVRLSPPPPAATTPSAPNPTAAPEEQLRHHVAQQIRSFEATDNRMRFSLSPYGMGDIEIEVVRGEGGRMQIAMTTESASVLQMLRHDREQLLDALNARGISADSSDLDFQTFGERGRQDGREPQAASHSNAEGAGQSENLSDSDASAPPAPRNASGPGQLDILT